MSGAAAAEAVQTVDALVWSEASEFLVSNLLKSLRQAAPVVVCVGGGVGSSVAGLLRLLPSGGQVLVLDTWHAPTTVSGLRQEGHGAEADAVARLASARSQSLCGVFARRFRPDAEEGEAAWAAASAATQLPWGEEGAWLRTPDLRVTVVLGNLRQAVSKLEQWGMSPTILYLDALSSDLDSNGLKQTLELMRDRYPQACIAGGGWGASVSVRQAVASVAASRAQQLHVEQGRAWLIATEVRVETRNTSEDTRTTARQLAEARGDVDKIRAAVRKGGAQEWVSRLVRILTHAGEDAAELARGLLGRHARTERLAPEDADSDLPGALPGESEDVWIDVPGDDDKEYTLLMQVAKVGRADLICFLVDECGARTRVRSGRHQMTALHIAAHRNAADCVHELLRRRADPNAKNWRDETPADTATDPLIVDMLRRAAAATEPAAAPPATATASASASAPPPKPT